MFGKKSESQPKEVVTKEQINKDWQATKSDWQTSTGQEDCPYDPDAYWTTEAIRERMQGGRSRG